MKTFDEDIGRHLQDALASGELAKTPGFGKPLPEDPGFDDTPEALRMPFKILKNAGAAPPEIQLFHDRAALAAAVRDCADPAERLVLQQRLSELEQRIALRLEALRVNASL